MNRIKSEEISERLIGEEADIVLDSKKVFHGMITNIENNIVYISSLQAHKLNFAINTISEIIICK